jgi:acetyl esterase/lipase
MRRLMLIGAAAGTLIVALLAVGFLFPLQLFNFVVPKDAGGTVLLRDVSFGALPRQKLDVYAPTEATGAPRPILVYLYGGSWANGTRTGYDFVGRAFAAAGFVVVVPDYRLYPDVRYPSFLKDCAAAIAWARAHAAEIGGDPDRIVLVGHSAGAYNASMLALDGRWLGAADVPREAIVAWAALAGPYDFLPLDVAATQRTFGAVEDLAATQPINYVDANDPPALLATGAVDRTVAPRHTTTLAALMRNAGITTETRIYDGIGHLGIVAAIARPLRSRAPVLADIVMFLKARLAEAG